MSDEFINNHINKFDYSISADKVNLSKFKGNQFVIKKANEWIISMLGLIPTTSSIKRKLFLPKDTAWKEGKFNGITGAANKIKKLFKHADKNFLDNEDIAKKFLDIIRTANNNYKSQALDAKSVKSIRRYEEKRMYLYTAICLWNNFLGKT